MCVGNGAEGARAPAPDFAYKSCFVMAQFTLNLLKYEFFCSISLYFKIHITENNTELVTKLQKSNCASCRHGSVVCDGNGAEGACAPAPDFAYKSCFVIAQFTLYLLKYEFFCSISLYFKKITQNL